MTVSNTGLINLLDIGNATLIYTYTNNNNCSSNKSITGSVVSCAARGLGLNINESETQLLVYPNPAKDILQFSSFVGEIEIYNMYGKVIMRNKSLTNSINISQLPNGCYIIKSNQAISKFIVNH
jgi:hypothetical protein